MERILVVHVKRSGSTTLCKGLSETLGLKHYTSPFRPWILNQPKELQVYFNSKCILQTESIQYSNNLLGSLIEGFNKVILLSRKNIRDAIESYAYINYHNTETHSYFNSHTSRYVWKKTPNFEKSKSEILIQEKVLLELSTKYNIPITYYEDLYYDSQLNTLKDLKLNINEEEFAKKYLNPTNRQRRLTSGSIL